MIEHNLVTNVGVVVLRDNTPLNILATTIFKIEFSCGVYPLTWE